MTEQAFWEIIESAWADSPDLNNKRIEAVENNDEELLEAVSEGLSGEILANYKKRLLLLDETDFISFIHTLEERLYNIDREEIHEYTDGSDDGFLYCRCFILGMGKKYYDMIDETPSKATYDLDAETFGFFVYQIYEEKFGKEVERYKFHCIETCSNKAGWNN